MGQSDLVWCLPSGFWCQRLASGLGGFQIFKMFKKFNFSRPWILDQQGLAGANPLWDWPNNFNYMFIFVFGYAITATEELGVRESLRGGRWFYFVAGLIISSLKMSMSKLGEQLANGPHPWAYGVIDGMLK